MKILAVFLTLLVLTSAQFGGFGNLAKHFAKDVPIVSYAQDFIDFTLKYSKSYATPAERALREKVFVERKKLIDKNNAAFEAGKSTYRSGINALTDMTNAEIIIKFTGSKRTGAGDEMAKQYQQTFEPPATKQTIPESFDWREKQGVTPIKRALRCGSCWAFVVTGAIEGHVFRKTGKLPNLSEQNLLDCGTNEFGLDGCDGGFHDYGFAFIKKQKGIASTEKYPYEGKDKKTKTCAYTEEMKAAEVKGFALIPEKDEETIKQVIATLGPVACAMRFSDTLNDYESGIYTDEICDKCTFKHAVLLVGYNSTTNGEDYWIIKNDFGRNWGEKGFFRLPRGKNTCGISEYCSIPLV